MDTALIVSLFAGILLGAMSVSAQPVMPVSSPTTATAHSLSAKVRHDTVAALASALRDNYIFPEVGELAAAKVEQALAAGEYNAITAPADLATRLSADITDVAHDKHLRVWSANTRPAPPAEELTTPKSEAGVVRADKLASGIGYIEVSGFTPASLFKEAVSKALTRLKGSRALIIDDRRNGGGEPEAVGYLVSFLVAPGTLINDIVYRVPKSTNFTRESFRSVPTPVSFSDVPIYVLTSHNTFSGGEGFAYHVQALKRGVVIGEVTGGGANPADIMRLGNGVVAMIPVGRPESPITKTNWEGRGVQPDIRVPATEALKVALAKLGGEPVAEIRQASLEQVFVPRSSPQSGSDKALGKLIGDFASGKPDYSAMTSEYARQAKEDAPRLQAKLAPLGHLRSIKFREVDFAGGDQYVVTFANGVRLMGIMLDSSGKVFGLSDPAALPD